MESKTKNYNQFKSRQFSNNSINNKLNEINKSLNKIGYNNKVISNRDMARDMNRDLSNNNISNMILDTSFKEFLTSSKHEKSPKINLNESTIHYPSFQETLSNFQNIILEAERELSNSSLKQPDCIRSFEAKSLPKFNSKVIQRRKSVNVKYSKSRLQQKEEERRSSDQFSKQNADSDDEKSKNKILNSSIIEKRNKISAKLNLENANEHFTNLIRLRNENQLVKLVKMHLLLLLDLDGENFSNVFEEQSNPKKTNTAKKKKQDHKSQDRSMF